MRGWEGASVLFFAYIAILATLPRFRATGRSRYVGVAAIAGMLIAFGASRAPYVALVHDWLLPPALLLMGYWTSGRLFVAPIAWQERLLERIDCAFRINAIARRVPRWLADLLEVGYVTIYPLIPAALIVHLVYLPNPDPSRFWTVILATDYVCFSVLPWVQTRPPRALETLEPWRSPLRTLNLRLVGATSIQVNTFPSGHAAEALACALLVLGTPSFAVALIFAGACAVSAGAVLGRYHFAADAIAGWMVAVVVWLMFL